MLPNDLVVQFNHGNVNLNDPATKSHVGPIGLRPLRMLHTVSQLRVLD